MEIPSYNTSKNFPWQRRTHADSQRSFIESMDSGFSSSQSSFHTGSQLHASSQLLGESQEKSQGSSQASMQKLYKMYVGKKPSQTGLTAQEEHNSCEIISTGLAKELLEKISILNENIARHLSQQETFISLQKKLFDEVENKLNCCIEEVKTSLAKLFLEVDQLKQKISEESCQVVSLKQDIHLSRFQGLEFIASNLRDTILADTQFILRTLQEVNYGGEKVSRNVENVLTRSFADLREYVGEEIRACQRSPQSRTTIHQWDSPFSSASAKRSSIKRRSLPPIQRSASRTVKMRAKHGRVPPRNVHVPSDHSVTSLTIAGRQLSIFDEPSLSAANKPKTSTEMATPGACRKARHRHTPIKSQNLPPCRKKRLVLQRSTVSSVVDGNWRSQRILLSPGSWAPKSLSSVNSVDLEMESRMSSQSSTTMSLNFLSLDF